MGHKILLVADAESSPPWLVPAMEQAGHSVLAVSGAQNATVKARGFRPSVVVLVQPPPPAAAAPADGPKATDLAAEVNVLRIHPATVVLPLMVLSADVSPPMLIKLLRGGATEVMPVAVAEQDFLSRFHSVVGLEPASAPVADLSGRAGPAVLRRLGDHLLRYGAEGVLRVTNLPDHPVLWFLRGTMATGQPGTPDSATVAQRLLSMRVTDPWLFEFEARQFQLPEAAPPPALSAPAPRMPTPPARQAPVTSAPPRAGAASPAAAWDPFAPAPKAEPDRPQLPLPTPEQLAALPPIRVLVVDDEASFLNIYGTTLRRADMLVWTAEDGAAGVRKAREIIPDLIISDIMMPKLDGWGLLAAVREDPKLCEARFVFSSANTSHLERLRAVDSGADEYLDKAQHLSQLVHVVQRVMASRRNLLAAMRPGLAFSGRVSAIGIQHLLEGLTRAAVEGQLEVQDGVGTYKVSMERGLILNAHARIQERPLEGMACLTQLFSVDEASFSFDPNIVDGTCQLGISFLRIWETLCAQVSKQRARIQAAIMADDSTLSFNQTLLAVYRTLVPEQVQPVLQALAAGTAPKTLARGEPARANMIELVVRDMLMRGVAELHSTSGAQPPPAL